MNTNEEENEMFKILDDSYYDLLFEGRSIYFDIPNKFLDLRFRLFNTHRKIEYFIDN
jgi:hypothetical protein